MTKNSTYFSLSRAAKESGKSKSVIHKALDDGTLSFVEKTKAGYKIDPAELFRVFPKEPKKTFENDNTERSRTTENGAENTLKIRELELKLEAETQQKAFFKEQLQKLEQDRNEWRNQAQRLLLTAGSQEPEAAATKPKKGGIFGLFK